MKIKNKKGESEKFGRNNRLAYVTIALAITLISASVFLYLYTVQHPQPKAAIIDQLSSSQLTDISCHSNQTFIETAGELLL